MGGGGGGVVGGADGVENETVGVEKEIEEVVRVTIVLF